MKIDQYEVTVKFDLAVMQGHEDADRVALELNKLFHEIVKAWARDRAVMASPTRTTVETGVRAA